jgi:hypothetical protein
VHAKVSETVTTVTSAYGNIGLTLSTEEVNRNFLSCLLLSLQLLGVFTA